MLDAICAALHKGNVCVTGGGGVGKTYTTNAVIERMEKAGKKFAVTALTGLASTHLKGGMTIHSFAGISNKISMTDFEGVIGSKSFMLAREFIKGVEYLIVDETSMWRPDTFELVDGVCRHARQNLDVPFGGIRVMLVGDFLQLPPVIGREEKLAEQWVFENLTWKEGNFKTFNLTEIKRQSDTDLINGLNALRFGEYNEQSKWLLKECKDRPLSQEAVVLMSRVKDVTDYNEYRMGLLTTPEENYNAIVKVKDIAEDPRQVYRDLMDKNLEQNIKLKVGCRVMVTANMQNGLKNGVTGEYLGITNLSGGTVNDTFNDALRIKLDNGTEAILPRLRLGVYHKWELDEDGKPIEEGFIMQFPIKLAFAITIHKSQGMTLDSVMIDSRGIFAEGQIYVAASRAKSLEGLSIMGFDKRHIKANQKAVNFYRSLQ